MKNRRPSENSGWSAALFFDFMEAKNPTVPQYEPTEPAMKISQHISQNHTTGHDPKRSHTVGRVCEDTKSCAFRFCPYILCKSPICNHVCCKYFT